MAVLPIKYHRAARQLRAGGVIAYPTEAVWGFGCDPDNLKAVAKLLSLKQRPVSKGLILVAASIEQFSKYLEGLSPSLQDKFGRPTGVPTTWLVPVNKHAQPWVTGDYDSIALRVSAYKPVVDLCSAFGAPLVSTSANIAGKPPCQWPWQMHRYLGVGLDYILPGSTGGNAKPSEIRDLVSDKVIRSG
ncbi:MAG: Sua5/YciO/YrdC/YwlC family protein [Oceanicoccus sp.]